jgi:hypothetical protein
MKENINSGCTKLSRVGSAFSIHFLSHANGKIFVERNSEAKSGSCHRSTDNVYHPSKDGQLVGRLPAFYLQGLIEPEI